MASLGSGGHNDLLLLLVRPFRSHTAANSDDNGDDDDNKWNDDRNNDDGDGDTGRDVFDGGIAAILIATGCPLFITVNITTACCIAKTLSAVA